MDLKQFLFNVFPAETSSPLAAAGIEPGLYHYMREEGGQPTRFHLRVDSSGDGLLVANAAAIARLHPSGVIVAKGLLEGESGPSIADRLDAVFHGVTPDRAAADVREVEKLIAELLAPGDNYPILNLADPAFTPGAAPLDRPLSADLPLAEPARIEPILERLWELGIPHVTLIAGDEPDAAALVRAVEKAEDLGMIAGVRGRGSVLVQGTLLHDLAAAGVDHVDVLYLAADPKVHDALAGEGDHESAVAAIEHIHADEVCPVVEIALVESTFEHVDQTLGSLAGLGVRNAAFYAVAMAAGKTSAGALPGDRLVHAAQAVEESAARADVRFIWYPPVRFFQGRSLAGVVLGGPRASGDTAVRVEPDGSVIPARGPNQPAGNLLADPWERIARSGPYRAYRRRVETDTHCDTCPGLAVCAADCPRDPEGWVQG